MHERKERETRRKIIMVDGEDSKNEEEEWQHLARLKGFSRATLYDRLFQKACSV